MRKDYHSVVPASYVLLRQNSKILLLRRANVEYANGLYSLPSGHVKPWEGPVKAAAREAREEVGVEIRPADLTFLTVAVCPAVERNYERVNFFFEASKWQGEPRICEPDKCDDVRWFELDDLPENIEPRLLAALQAIENNAVYFEFDYENL